MANTIDVLVLSLSLTEKKVGIHPNLEKTVNRQLGDNQTDVKRKQKHLLFAKNRKNCEKKLIEN